MPSIQLNRLSELPYSAPRGRVDKVGGIWSFLCCPAVCPVSFRYASSSYFFLFCWPGGRGRGTIAQVVDHMLDLWASGEKDMLDEHNQYSLSNTGQGLQRVQVGFWLLFVNCCCCYCCCFVCCCCCCWMVPAHRTLTTTTTVLFHLLSNHFFGLQRGRLLSHPTFCRTLFSIFDVFLPVLN